jgi:hypothetical protein
MHRHCNKNGTAPFVGNCETASEDEQWHKGREVCVRRGEQQGAEHDTNQAAKIAFDYIVEEKSKQKFLNYWSDRYCEDNDHDSLLDRARAAEKLDDILPARTASKKPLRNDVSPQNQWISEHQQNCSSAQHAEKGDSGKTS